MIATFTNIFCHLLLKPQYFWNINSQQRTNKTSLLQKKRGSKNLLSSKFKILNYIPDSVPINY